ncbi:hypothetical protein DPMN_039172 [Dreissena polymorpha]|uniref:Uncharacterized protein n=1 Tax=Dreissena polymorpha TaxID=45954 RepID=A0A9D4MGU8_DREPO|nr:hypothetical protein DPMN_039172 [Dreissena polymorpha]
MAASVVVLDDETVAIAVFNTTSAFDLFEDAKNTAASGCGDSTSGFLCSSITDRSVILPVAVLTAFV